MHLVGCVRRMGIIIFKNHLYLLNLLASSNNQLNMVLLEL